MPKRRAVPSNPQSSESEPSPARRRVHRSSSAASSASESQTQTQTAPHSTLIKKLVRYALSCEYARIPIRRSDISAKVLGEGNSRQFRVVFDGAQQELERTFGMRIVELPGRERMGLKERRAAQSQTKIPAGSSTTKSYVLTTTLPPSYQTATTSDLRPLLPPSLAPHEAAYTALYTTVIALLTLSPTSSLPEAKLDRYLRRLNADVYTPMGKKEDVLKRMEKEGYVERRREVVGGEEGVEYTVGPRGRIEVGITGVAGLVRRVYGLEGEDDGEQNTARTERREDLEKRLERSLGLGVKANGARVEEDGEEEDGGREAPPQVQEEEPRRTTRGRPRRAQNEDD